jgi:predicted GTPase
MRRARRAQAGDRRVRHGPQGLGKSQTSRWVVSMLAEQGLRWHRRAPSMPTATRAQRRAALRELDEHAARGCSLEEMEEYEQARRARRRRLRRVDYEAILRRAEAEADVLLWDGGNNDTPFFAPDLWITVADPHRPGHERSYFPGHVNFERAGVLVVNKVDTAEPEGIATVEDNARRVNPHARLVRADSPVSVRDPGAIRGKRVLAVEDGPTLTHGNMRYGAASVAARRYGAAELVDPRPWLVGELKDTFRAYPDIGPLLPAMGYGEQQVRDLEATIGAVKCDLVLIGTPVDLARIVRLTQSSQRVTYRLDPEGDELRKAVLAAVSAKSAG